MIDLQTMIEAAVQAGVDKAVERILAASQRPQVLTVTDVAREVGCSRSTIYEALRSGRLKHFTPVEGGAQVRIRREALNAWIAEREEICTQQPAYLRRRPGA